jgi:glycosyltransferase involved in cell wall biosynthesis
LLSPDGFAFRLCAWLEAFCYRRAWLVAGQSKSILASINERFPHCRTFHLSNGVDSRRFDPGLQSESARKLLASNGSCVVLYAGLHGIAQGLDQVLRAAEALKTEGGFRFVLVGDGPEKKELLEQAGQRGLGNVQFMEPRPAKDVPALLAAADVILVPLKSYIPGAVPSKLYEAMASERPVVLVASGEAADIVSEHRVGITVKPGDVQGLADALRTLRAAPQLRQTLAANGRNAAVQYFDRKKIMDGFIEYLGANFHS